MRNMQTRDHRMLAGFLASGMERGIPDVYIKAFVWGNVEPDKNLFTYLHGFAGGKRFHGHNYENMLPVMKRLFYSIQKKERWGIREYYRLGKLLHYAADAFTFPHNGAFEGNLREHCEYEQRLHERLSAALRRGEGTEEGGAADAGGCFRNIEVLHEEYLRRKGSCENDCRYILRAAEMLLREEPERAVRMSFAGVGRAAG